MSLKAQAPESQLNCNLQNMPIGPGLIFGKFSSSSSCRFPAKLIGMLPVTDWHQLSAGYSPHVLLKRLISGKL